MIKFGPSGADENFAAMGFTSTMEMPQYVADNDLDIFEYSFGRGVRMTQETAIKIGKAFADKNIGISVHAPYYINFANEDPLKIRASFDYLLQSLFAVRAMGGNRCVFHPGSPLKADRADAMQRLLANVNVFMEEFYLQGFENQFVCVETMGKINQLGNLDEVIEICKLDRAIKPCVDFGHLNARTLGGLKTKDDYKKVMDSLIDALGYDRVKEFHVHFSKIAYTDGGEKNHLTFDDCIYGPEFEPLAEVFAEYKLEPWVLSESAGTQCRDAKIMKEMYAKISAK